MDLPANIAASRVVAQLRAMDVTAANVANANTPGYRAERMLFSDWLQRQRDTASPPGGQVIAYTQDRATWRDSTAGPMSRTGNPLDLALSKDGYFTVGTPTGPRLTRSGRFGLLPNGTIADSAGEALLDTNGRPIQLSPADTQLTVAADGTLSSENGQIAQIGVVRPQDAMRLSAEGGTLFRADTPTAAVSAPGVVQGAVEGSNVQPVLELNRMMDDYRQFQFLGQFLQAESDRQQSAIEKLLPQVS